MKSLRLIISLNLFLFMATVQAQVNIGSSVPPNASAVLELTSANKGLLLPRVALTATNSSSPVTSPATGLIIYNTATSGTSPNTVVPGIYLWDGTAWSRVDNRNLRNAVLVPVLNNILLSPPSIKNDGDAYLVPASATGDWVGKTNMIASWDNILSSWQFYTPVNADQISVTTGTNAGKIYSYNGTQWNEKPGGALGYVPASSNTLLTINGTTFDLSANRTWNISTGSSTLSGLNDVSMGTLHNAELLQYDNLSSKWVNAAPAFWGINGNAGTSTSTNFIGTTDNTDLVFKIYNHFSGTISSENTSLGFHSMSNTGAFNTAFGNYALGKNVSSFNTGIGYKSLDSNTTGSSNTALGYGSLQRNISGNWNTAIGGNSLLNNGSGSANTAVGQNSMMALASGSNNTAMGHFALNALTSSYSNTAIGSFAISKNTTGYGNTAVGQNALLENISGSSNTILGYNTMNKNTGSNNTAVGESAGFYNTGSGNIFLGFNAGMNSLGDNKLFIQNSNATIPLIYGDFSTGRVGLGTVSPNTKLEINAGAANTSGLRFTQLTALTPPLINGFRAVGVDSTGNLITISGGWSLTGNTGTNTTSNFIGTTDNADLVFKRQNNFAGNLTEDNTSFGLFSMNGNTGGSSTAFGSYSLRYNSGINNSAVGTYALNSNTTGNNNTAVGSQSLRFNESGGVNTSLGAFALNLNVTGTGNTAIGALSQKNSVTTSYNTSVGQIAMRENLTGMSNTAVGMGALLSNTSGNDNTAIGMGASYFNVTGSSNVTVGQGAGNQSTGSNNVFVGRESGFFATGSGNVYLGFNAGSGATGDNKLYIQNSNALIPLIYGDFSSGRVGLGTISPNDKLEINSGAINNSGLRFTQLTASSPAITTGTMGIGVDANGNVVTVGSGWTTSGNAGTNPSIHFLGTSDNTDLIFKRYNLRAGLLSASNTSFGVSALNPAVSGQDNAAFGNSSLTNTTTGYSNVAMGSSSLSANTTGFENVAIGYNALTGNSTGSQNTAIGTKALMLTSTGVNNIAVGSSALYSNVNGNLNVAIGYSAMYSNSSGYENAAFGENSLRNNGIGYRSTAAGALSLSGNTTGIMNTAVGWNALSGNTTGDYNTALGSAAFATGAGFSNAMALGYAAEITANNQIRLGNSAVTSIGGFCDWTNVSDGRFKNNIKENVPGIDFILKLRPVTYHLNPDAIAVTLKTPDSLRLWEAEKQKSRVVETGFIAQEVEKAANELGFDFSGVDKPTDNTGYYGLKYASFTAPLVKAVQEQQAIIENLQKELSALKARLLVLENKK